MKAKLIGAAAILLGVVAACAGPRDSAGPSATPAASSGVIAPANPQPTGLKPGLAVNIYFADFGHVDEVVDIASRKDPLVGEPLADLSFRSSGKVLGTKFDNLVGAVITGYVRFPEARGYRLRVVSNDGVRVTLSGQTIYEDPKPHPDRTLGPVDVEIPEAGWYPIEVVWFERKGSHALQLAWSAEGGSGPQYGH